MLRQIIASACLAGFIAGVVLTLAQQPQVIPIIQAAETYESAAPAAHQHSHGHENGVVHEHAHSHEHGPGHAHAHAPGNVSGHTHADGTHGAHANDGAHSHGGDAWTPADGFERTFWTLLSNVAGAIGFALLLCALYALRPTVTPMRGLLWGAAGFVVFFANPGIGLQPEIPGAMAADLGDRQMWWLLTVICSAAAVGLVAMRKEPWLRVGAVGLLVLPHVFGAPQPEIHGGLAPQSLADQFVWASAIANAVFWLTLGVISAVVFRRLGSPAAA